MKKLLSLVLFLPIGNRSNLDNVSLFLRFLVYETGSSKSTCGLAKHGVECLPSQYPGSVRKRDQPGLYREPNSKKETYTHTTDVTGLLNRLNELIFMHMT